MPGPSLDLRCLPAVPAVTRRNARATSVRARSSSSSRLPISTRVRGGVAAALSQLKPALRNAVRLRDVEIDGEVVRIPGDFPH